VKFVEPSLNFCILITFGSELSSVKKSKPSIMFIPVISKFLLNCKTSLVSTSIGVTVFVFVSYSAIMCVELLVTNQYILR
jgi:hypothetical protein